LPPKKNPLPKIGAFMAGAIALAGSSATAMPPESAIVSPAPQDENTGDWLKVPSEAGGKDLTAARQAQLLKKAEGSWIISTRDITVSPSQDPPSRSVVVERAKSVAIDSNATYDDVTKAEFDLDVASIFASSIFASGYIDWVVLIGIAANIAQIFGVDVLKMMERLKSKSDKKRAPCNQSKKIQIVLSQTSWTKSQLASKIGESKELAKSNLQTFGFVYNKHTQLWEETEVTKCYKRELASVL